MIALHPEALAAIRAHGSRDYPNECCGLLLGTESGGRKVVSEAWPVANTWADTEDETRRRRYRIGPEDMLAGQQYADGKSLDILGFYHSHPDHPARPSATDLKLAAYHFWSYMILSVEKGQPAALTSWLMSEDRSKFEEEPVEICQPKS